MTRIVVLISGRGSNMRAIVEACQSGTIDGSVVAVISNTDKAQGLDYARSQNIEAAVLDHTLFTDRNEFDAQLLTLVDSYQPDWLVLAGFMRILNADFVNHFLGRMINIHPSLLPLYPGLNTHKKVLAAGDTVHGATAHFVTPELDAGPAIAQTQVPVLPTDTEQTLANRVLQAEHELFTQALQLCVSGVARYTNGKCTLGNDMTKIPATGHQQGEPS